MYAVGYTCDGNCKYTTVKYAENPDTTPPVITSAPVWTSNPLLQGQNTTLSVGVSDAESGVSSAQYSINGAMPQPMTYDSATNLWKASFGSTLAVNTYNVAITATDTAGNTSVPVTDVLAVYSTANGYVTGHAKTLPTISDTLPITLDTSNKPAQLVVGFTNVTAPTSGSFNLSYVIKNNQNAFNLSSTGITWVLVQDSSHASILGYGDLTTYVNGVKTITQNMTVRFDIVLGTNGAADQITIKMFNPGTDPNTGTPAYVISDAVIPNGSNLMIHP